MLLRGNPKGQIGDTEPWLDRELYGRDRSISRSESSFARRYSEEIW